MGKQSRDTAMMPSFTSGMFIMILLSPFYDFINKLTRDLVFGQAANRSLQAG